MSFIRDIKIAIVSGPFVLTPALLIIQVRLSQSFVICAKLCAHYPLSFHGLSNSRSGFHQQASIGKSSTGGQRFMSELVLVRHGQASFFSDDYDQLSPLGELQSQTLGQ